MKNTIIMLLLCLLSGQAVSQEVSFYLHIMDKERIVSYYESVPIFDDPEINSIFGDYTVSHFAKAFPLSGYEYLQKVYLIQANSIGLAQELVSYDNVLFPIYEEIGEAIPLGSYYPNDWTGDWPYDTLQLSFINAPVAWNITRGDPNTLIAVEDFYFDLSHPDMQGQYARIGVNYPYPAQPEHGTLVSSLIAAKTDNNIGITGIGFNCRLVANSPNGFRTASWILSQAMDTSMGRVRVSNASYRNSEKEKLYFLSIRTGNSEQGAYNEIYERGVVAVSAAGNGAAPPFTSNAYFFPASYDHNISVSGVGYEDDNIVDSAFNARYVHEFYAGDSTRSHQHNDRVDICAPSFRVSGHDYDPNDPSVKYKWRGGADGGGGTSFAAPMVAGTAGLILSHRPWLTPYQVEYVLKKSSFNHYTIPYNQKYAGPTRWKGRIGAGTLDAGAALQMVDVDNFFHDHPDALTFRIKGVKINNRCVPGSHTGVPNPKLEVVMENGKPPYRYKWEAMPDNNAEISPRLDSVGANQINVTITGVTGSNPNPVFHYRLTVYDNSDIEKVANKIVKIQLTDEDVWDLAMQDAYADMYDEPNQMEVRSYLDWNIWESPDLWNRLTNDGGQEHQDPDTMTTNYLYVRVKNIGCIPSPTNADSASLNLYWSLASTGEVWERDWVGNSTLPGTSLPAGGRITPISGIPIPSIDPGAERILSKDWIPPRPQDFDTSGMLTRIDVCALARITTLDSDLGLAFPEIDTTKVNVRNNNNIVTRNFVTINLSGSHNTGGVVVSDPSSSAVAPTITVEVTTENQLHPFIHGHLATYMDMELHLGGLYDKWVAGGKQGNPTASNDGMKTVTWDMEKPLRLENISLEENEAHLVILEFNRKEGVDPAYPVVDQMVYFRMVNPVTVDIDNGDGTSFPVVRDNVIGSVNYSINIPADNPGGQKTNPSGLGEEVEKMKSWFDVYPNPTDGQLTVQLSGVSEGNFRVLVVDMSGRTIFEDDKAAFHNGIFRINTSSFTPGIYFIQLTDSQGKASLRKFVKAD